MRNTPRQSSPRSGDETNIFAACVLEGLSARQKSLPCRYFYDDRGSELFEAITRLPEYYLTNAEVAILRAHAAEMLEGELSGAILIEFGSGSCCKTEILLSQAPQLCAYVPIDISGGALAHAKTRLEARFPALKVRPMIGDFTRGFSLQGDLSDRRSIGFFPGSTIGNFAPAEACALLRTLREAFSPGVRLLVGVDLKKDPRRLLCAYNDAAGITASFNLNLLVRINRELDGNFDLSSFKHEAVYEPVVGRVEMHLKSVKDQIVRVADTHFHFGAAETIHTENSYKYTIDQFREIACLSGWKARRVWTDNSQLFSMHELVASL